MRIGLGNTHMRSPFFLFMSHCRWTCVSHAESDTSSDLQGANDIIGLVENAQYSGDWDDIHTDVTDIEDLSSESAFITEDMLQSISTGGCSSATYVNLNAATHQNRSCGVALGCNTSLRNILVAHQQDSNSSAVHHELQLDNNSDSDRSGPIDNQMQTVCVNGNPITNSNRSSVESNNSNNIFYELQNMSHSSNINVVKPQQHQCLDVNLNRNQNISNDNSNTHPADTDAPTYENVPVVNNNRRTIEVSGCTNTCSSDSCIQGVALNRTSDISLSSDLSGAAGDVESILTDNSGAASGSAEDNAQLNSNPPNELSDILFRFDRQFRVNTGFGFANWRWPHRLSNHSASSGSTGNRPSPENTLQQQARFLRRLQMHHLNGTPTNSNSNSLRSNSSGSSSGVRGTNLQQDWYFYDPRLVPQHRTQRIAMHTSQNRVQTTSYVSNIINPPTYEELINVSQGEAVPTGSLTNVPEAPPAFEDIQMMEPLINLDFGTLPNEPPPPYVDTERPPVYDLDPSALIDPPPQYDDHSFSEDDLPRDPMDPSPVCQSENENFILAQPTTMTSETDGNFILSAVPNLRSANRQDVAITPDNRSITSDNDSEVASGSNDVSSGLSECDENSSSSSVERNSHLLGPDDSPSSCTMDLQRHRPLLPLEELFRSQNILEGERSSNDSEPLTDESDLSNDECEYENSSREQVQIPRSPTSRIFPGYQLLHNSPEPPHWSRLGHVPNQNTSQVDDSLDDVTDELDDDLSGFQEDNSRSLANFPIDDYPAGFVSGHRPPLRWSRGLGPWNLHNWAT